MRPKRMQWRLARETLLKGVDCERVETECSRHVSGKAARPVFADALGMMSCVPGAPFRVAAVTVIEWAQPTSTFNAS